MKNPSNKLAFVTFLLIFIIFGCDPSEGTGESETSTFIPEPEPYNTSGDELYSIYRKGLITRHMTKNGRIYERVGLKSIDSITDEKWRKADNKIFVTYPNGEEYPISKGNIRYSYEKVTGETNPVPHLWVPMTGPLKEPGYGNKIIETLAGDGDNPCYYGGMALAMFSLEAKHNVSNHSIHYARKIVQFFLNSEMNGGNGYMLRHARPFNSGRNINGAPILQGASAEELLGTMLGLMYYLKVEKESHPLYKKARELQKRILNKVSKGNFQTDKYEHPFMNSNGDPSYRLKHFELPLYASTGIHNTGNIGEVKNYYMSILTLGSGDTRPHGRDFHDYVMFLTSMILVLEGDIPDKEKEWYAKVFMRDVIKASNVAGPDINNLKSHAYMAVVGQLVNKYLNNSRNSWRTSSTLQDIWGNDFDKWREIRENVSIISEASSTSGILKWQHNLPFLNPCKSIDNCEENSFWKNHNKEKKIGDWFTWIRSSPYYYNNDLYNFHKGVPGWLSTEFSWVEEVPPFENINEFEDSRNKRFSTYDFINNHLISNNHKDNQIEGAGLGLTFLRMILTEINPDRYPAPILQEGYDEWFPWLPYEGYEPMSPFSFRYKYKNWSKENGNYKIQGDNDDVLSVAKLKGDHVNSSNFVVAYAGKDEKLKLTTGLILNEDNQDNLEPLFLNSNSTIGKKIDKVIIKAASEGFVVTAERAEKDNTFGRDDHWLRVTLWHTNSSSTRAGYLERKDRWASSSKHHDSCQELDLCILNGNLIVVGYKTRHNRNKIRVFKIDFNNSKIIDLGVNIQASGDTEVIDRVKITTAYNNIVLCSSQLNSNLFSITSKRWNGSSLENAGTTSRIKGKLLDMTVTKRSVFSREERRMVDTYYLVGVVKFNDFLKLHSWEIQESGYPVYRGDFDTKYGESYLVSRESDFERASIAPNNSQYLPGFIIAGKGVGMEVRSEDGDWNKTAKGLKVIYGYIMEDGRPTITDSQPFGSGSNNSIQMVDITAGGLINNDDWGFLTAHKTKDEHLMLVYWIDGE